MCVLGMSPLNFFILRFALSGRGNQGEIHRRTRHQNYRSALRNKLREVFCKQIEAEGVAYPCYV